MSAAATGESPLSATERATTEPPASWALPPRRVRDEVRDGLAVIVVSALASTGLALVLVVLTTLAG